MGVAGGAVFPPIQGAVADGASTRLSMVIPLVGFVYVFGYSFYHWFTHGRYFMRVKHIVVLADTAGRRGTSLGGALGGAINYVHYTVEKEPIVTETESGTASAVAGGRRASVVSGGRRQSVAIQVRRPSVATGAIVEEEQKGNPILL